MIFPVVFGVLFVVYSPSFIPAPNGTLMGLVLYVVMIGASVLVSIVGGFCCAVVLGYVVPKKWVFVRKNAMENIHGKEGLFLYTRKVFPRGGGKTETFVEYGEGGKFFMIPGEMVRVIEEGIASGVLVVEKKQFAHPFWVIAAIDVLDDPPTKHRYSFYVPVGSVAKAIDEIA